MKDWKNINTNVDEVNRIEAEYATKAMPIREVILGRCVGQDDLVVFWLDAKDRPDVVDLVRVHEMDGAVYNGEFKIVPIMFSARNPLRFQFGLEVTLRDPVSCVFHLLFDYYSNREWILHMITSGRFGIETGTPDKSGRPPMAGAFLTLLLGPDVSAQMAVLIMEIEAAVALVAKEVPGLMQNRYRTESLFRGQVWLAKVAKTKEKPPRVPRGRQSNNLN